MTEHRKSLFESWSGADDRDQSEWDVNWTGTANGSYRSNKVRRSDSAPRLRTEKEGDKLIPVLYLCVHALQLPWGQQRRCIILQVKYFHNFRHHKEITVAVIYCFFIILKGQRKEREGGF